MSRRPLTSSLLVLLLLAGLATAAGARGSVSAAIWSPIQVTPHTTVHDSYGDRRGSRTHRGVDATAPQMTEVYAAESGYIGRAYGGDSRACLDGGSCSSYGLLVHGDDGNSYFYLHLNDDTPGRPNGCDHRGGAGNAFSPRLTEILRSRGTLEPRPHRWSSSGDVVRVEQGELLGYVGSSGNAGCSVDHLHFEMWAGHAFHGADDGRKADPYPHIRAALDGGRFWGPDGRPEPVPQDRIAGPNRVLTAVALSRRAFDDARTVVLAPAGVPQEALLAAPLASTLGGPVLLAFDRQRADQDVLGDQVAEEIERLGAEHAVIVGSTARLDGALEQQLVRKTSLRRDRIRRIAAPDRYELSRKVAELVLRYHGVGADDRRDGDSEAEDLLPYEGGGEASGPISPLLALGGAAASSQSWPDALAGSALAARQAVPVLLTGPGQLPDPVAEVLGRDGIGEVRIVGGPAAVSEEVEAAVRRRDRSTRRLQGPTRYHTALAVAEEAVRDGASPGQVLVATGRDFPDALAAGMAAAEMGTVLVLTDGAAADGTLPVTGWLRDHAERIGRLAGVGGTRAVTDAALADLAFHANWPR